jgi:2-(1,2-epoxy-1,2-dihydrophenyl)acetyl-CoA isomerase
VPALVGLARARRLLLSGELIDAETARAWGLVVDVIDNASLDDAFAERVAAAAAAPTIAVGMTKRLLSDTALGGLPGALRRESAALDVIVRTSDFKEGIAAFTGRRETAFQGR